MNACLYISIYFSIQYFIMNKTFLPSQIDSYSDFFLSDVFINSLLEVNFKKNEKDLERFVRLLFRWKNKPKNISEFNEYISWKEFKEALKKNIKASKWRYEWVDTNSLIESIFFDDRWATIVVDTVQKLTYFILGNNSEEEISSFMDAEIFFRHKVSNTIWNDLIWAWDFSPILFSEEANLSLLEPWNTQDFIEQTWKNDFTSYNEILWDFSIFVSPSWKEMVIGWDYLLNWESVEKEVVDWKIELFNIDNSSNKKLPNIASRLSKGKNITSFWVVNIKEKWNIVLSATIKNVSFWCTNSKWEIWILRLKPLWDFTFSPINSNKDRIFAQVLSVWK